MNLSEFELKISTNLSLSEKDSRKMDRTLDDIAQEIGMDKFEILDFISYSADEELKNLQFNYNWEIFRNKLIKRLKPKRQGKSS
ncbi:MAG: hypothetical protein L6Q54_10435 [Leptospiraceae bacterium]|nr:hypothetical protein [Leptospiraceae bacterium]MCK6381644.1 hypothetical protein [Leptospiraceae bacterium]NUM41086.1 hypothetical protein [Leptospiraceae bacterium]